MAVILPSAYRDGTTSVTQGSNAVEGHGTLFKFSVLPGDWYSTDDGFFIMISNVVDDTHLELIAPYPGSTISQGSYSIMLQSDIARMQETTRQLLETLRNGNLVAFAGLVGSVDKIPMFTGPGAMTLVNRSELISSIRYDETVDDIAGRAAYDGAAANFRVLVLDADGNGRSAFFTKNTAASGDWSEPLYVTGGRGLTGEPGPFTQIVAGDTTTLPAGSEATVTPRTVSEGVVALDFGVPRGVDGDGTGDVVGPSSVTAGSFTQFASDTGKLIGPATIGSPAFLGRVSSGVGDVERLSADQVRAALGGFEFIASENLAGVVSWSRSNLGSFRVLKMFVRLGSASEVGVLMRYSSNNGSDFYGASNYSFNASLSRASGVSYGSGIAEGASVHGGTFINAEHEILVSEFNTNGPTYSYSHGRKVDQSGSSVTLFQSSAVHNVSDIMNAVQLININGSPTFGFVSLFGIRG